ncbi:MAG: UDP-N-acetylmuramate dehydrogenase [Planctomycetota bacterium]|nr:MAG: UDP-N-acetylmuramate dehydrogenase [Planctomycetota bacterium]
MPSLVTSLAERFPCRSQEPLASWTTLRIGGPAECFFEPAKPEHLVDLLNALAAENIPWRLLGGGANVLAPDGGVNGAVIHTGQMRRSFREENKLRLWPGVTLPSLVRGAAELGLSGVESLIGVPGQIGGALAMNAGGADWGLWDEVEEVTLWWPDGRLEAWTPEQVRPGYRDGNLRGAVVVEVLLSLKPEKEAVIRQRMESLLKKKNASQPVTLSSAGCAFKNPPQDSAGRLLDAAGMKGQREGAALVSERHANFIVNAGGARAAQVRTLMQRMHQAVADRFGIDLQAELVIWPEPEPA